MILGLGNDIVEIGRINHIYKKFGNRFLNKIYTDNEIKIFNQNKSRLFHRLANRFAAKEAFYKALNHDKKSKIPSFKDVEILNSRGGKPYLNIYNTAQKLCLELMPIGCSYRVHLSISDEKHYVCAIVIIESFKID